MLLKIKARSAVPLIGQTYIVTGLSFIGTARAIVDLEFILKNPHLIMLNYKNIFLIN